MSTLINSLPQTIIDSLKKRTLTYNDMVQFTIAIRSKFNTFKTIPNAKLFWKMCAIKELHELMDEFPWQVWKKSFNIDYNKVKLEAIDVMTLVIGSMSQDNELVIDEQFDQPKQLLFDLNSTFISDDFIIQIDRILNYIDICVRPIGPLQAATQLNLCSLIKYLGGIAKMTHLEMCEYMVAKLSLVFCRIDLESGTYHSDWHKTTISGISECGVLKCCINEYNDRPNATLYDLARAVEEVSNMFRY